jgi:hypothetical protein
VGEEVEGADEDGSREDEELVSDATSVSVFASTGRDGTSCALNLTLRVLGCDKLQIALS